MKMWHNPFINSTVATNTGIGEGGILGNDVSNNGNDLGEIKNGGISKRQEGHGSRVFGVEWSLKWRRINLRQISIFPTAGFEET
jgi:hypothetical protein